jgi:hypothetical protein
MLCRVVKAPKNGDLPCYTLCWTTFLTIHSLACIIMLPSLSFCPVWASFVVHIVSFMQCHNLQEKLWETRLIQFIYHTTTWYFYFMVTYMWLLTLTRILQWYKASSCGWVACHINVHVMISPVVWSVAVIVESVSGAGRAVATARSL